MAYREHLDKEPCEACWDRKMEDLRKAEQSREILAFSAMERHQSCEHCGSSWTAQQRRVCSGASWLGRLFGGCRITLVKHIHVTCSECKHSYMMHLKGTQ